MLKNFFKTALRTIAKNQAYALINFTGLTTGIALALLIAAYVRSELSYDTFHEKADRLYRIRYDAPNGLGLASSPPPLAAAIKEYFPEVEETARLYGRNMSIKRPDAEETFEETGVYFADSTIMNMMTFEFMQGNPARPLADKFTVLINEEMATKYFGEANPVGEPLLFGGKHSFTVAGVVKNFPENSHIRFNMLVPYENMFDMETDETATLLRNNLAVNFVISHSYNYVLLKPGAVPATIDAGMDSLVKKYARPELQVGQKFTLMAVPNIHLRSTLLAEPGTTNSMTNLYIFIAVGILTILIACINYVNLSTAQSFSRIKEIAMRKILGSMKHQVILQFLAESFLFCVIAFALSYAVFYLALPLLNQVTGKELVFNEVVDWQLIAMSMALLLVITLLAGGYPSYFVTRFQSVNAIKGGANNLGSQRLRRVLVAFQLGIACLLLSGSLMIVKQLNYLSNRPLGFQKDHIITIPLFSQNLNGLFSRRDSLFQTRLQTYRDAVEAQTGVKQTTLSSSAPGLGVVFRGTIPEGFTQEDRLFIANIVVDYDFLQTYEMELIAGRFFDRSHGTDAAEGFVVNETAVKEFKWETPENALGKTINREGKLGKVIGVVKDFHFTSLTTAVSSLVMDVNVNQFNALSVRFENDNVQSTLDNLEAEWNRMFPEKAFQFTFLDEQLDQQYSNFQNFGTIIQTFTLIAVLISCLGVYGLVLFVVQRKVKEIGVRKVLGASVGSILNLIYKDFAVLILIGFVLAVPASYYLVSEWLKNFIYHTAIDPFTYLISFLLVLLVTALTIGYQALVASIANPVNSLRSE